jgi:predicted RNA binding protein YcfA (HicA-like mRNA interferase family)
MKITPIHWRKLVKVFELDGWKLSRIKGDHLIYTKEGFARPVVIPKDSSVATFIILNNLKTAGISRDKYFKLLKASKKLN